MDHVLRYQDTPGIKMIVVLGEVGVAPQEFKLLDLTLYNGILAIGHVN